MAITPNPSTQRVIFEARISRRRLLYIIKDRGADGYQTTTFVYDIGPSIQYLQAARPAGLHANLTPSLQVFAPKSEPRVPLPEHLDLNRGMEPDPADDPVAEPVVLLPADPVAEPVVLLPADPVLEPVVLLPADPVLEPVADPVLEPVAEPVLEPAEPVVLPAEPVLEPVAEPVLEPVVLLPADPVLEPAVPVLKPVAEPVVLLPADPVAEPVVLLPAVPVVLIPVPDYIRALQNDGSSEEEEAALTKSRV